MDNIVEVYQYPFFHDHHSGGVALHLWELEIKNVSEFDGVEHWYIFPDQNIRVCILFGRASWDEIIGIFGMNVVYHVDTMAIIKGLHTHKRKKLVCSER